MGERSLLKKGDTRELYKKFPTRIPTEFRIYRHGGNIKVIGKGKIEISVRTETRENRRDKEGK